MERRCVEGLIHSIHGAADEAEVYAEKGHFRRNADRLDPHRLKMDVEARKRVMQEEKSGQEQGHDRCERVGLCSN